MCKYELKAFIPDKIIAKVKMKDFTIYWSSGTSAHNLIIYFKFNSFYDKI